MVSTRWRASLAHEKLTKEYWSAEVPDAAAPSPRTSMVKPLEEAILPERLKMDVIAEYATAKERGSLSLPCMRPLLARKASECEPT